MTEQYENKIAGESWDQFQARDEYQRAAIDNSQSRHYITHDEVVMMEAWCNLRDDRKHWKGWEWNTETKQWELKRKQTKEN